MNTGTVIILGIPVFGIFTVCPLLFQSTGLVLAGLGLAALGFGGMYTIYLAIRTNFMVISTFVLDSAVRHAIFINIFII